jgi:hypothetical protein
MPLVFSFPIPSSLQDLEREPYNLEPYPRHFDEYQQQRGATTATTDDAASRADSFQHLVQSLQQGNRNLRAAGGAAFATTQEESQESQNSTINNIINEKNNDDDDEQQDEDDAWMDRERVQNLYTLVRYVEYSFFLARLLFKHKNSHLLCLSLLLLRYENH